MAHCSAVGSGCAGRDMDGTAVVQRGSGNQAKQVDRANWVK